MSARPRLFVAVDLGRDVRRGLERAIDEARALAADAKWIAVEHAHLTLAFLGGVDAAGVPAIDAALARAATRHSAITLDVHGAGTFGRPSSPRVLWIGVHGEIDLLAALHRDVTESLAALGFTPEAREFHPHVTLARSRAQGGERRLANAAVRLAETDAGRAHISHVALMQSHLSPRGARYTTLTRHGLTGTRTRVS